MLKKSHTRAAAKIIEEIKRRSEKPVEITDDKIEVVDIIETDKVELSTGDVIVSPAGTAYEIKEKDTETGGWLIAGIVGLFAILINGIIYLFRKK